MACAQTSGRTSGTSCPTPIAGVDNTQIWIGNRENITFTGGTSDKLYTDITMAGSTYLYPFVVHDKGADILGTLEVDENSGARSWVSEFTARLLMHDGAASLDIESLGTDLVV